MVGGQKVPKKKKHKRERDRNLSKKKAGGKKTAIRTEAPQGRGEK